MTSLVNTVNSITVDISTGLPVVAAGVSAGAAAKQAGQSKIQYITAGITAAAQAAQALPNPDVEAFAGLAGLIASLIHLL
jgi:hypothetical protein